MKNCLISISSIYDSLSYSEKKFADFVLANRERVVNMSIAEASEELRIAKSTIVEATQKIGFSGWREFKISLATELVNPIENWRGRNRDGNDEQDIIGSVVESNIGMMREIEHGLDISQVEKTADAILKARRVYIFGIGTSSILAKELFDSLFRLGIQCFSFDDLHYQKLNASRLEKDDLAIMVSQTGMNKEIIDLARVVKETGCTMIGISNFVGTPFGKLMDILLARPGKMVQDSGSNFVCRIPILCIIEILFNVLGKRMGTKFEAEMNHNWRVVKTSSLS